MSVRDWQLCTYKESTGGGKSDIKTKEEASWRKKYTHQRNNGESSVNIRGSRHGERLVYQTKA